MFSALVMFLFKPHFSPVFSVLYCFPAFEFPCDIMQGLSSPRSGPSEASKPPQYSSKDLRSFLEHVIQVANVTKKLLRAYGDLRETSGSCTQPPSDSVSCSPRRTYSFCFFCGQKGHIRANCGLCKKYLAAGKCLLVKGRVVLPTGQEIPREVPGRTLKDRLDCWDLGNRSNDNRKPPSSQGWLPSEDVGSRKPQTQMVPLGVSQPHSSVHPHPPSAQPLCAPLSAEGPSRHSASEQPQAPSRGHSESSSTRAPSRAVPTLDSRGRPPSCSRDLDDPHVYSYSSRQRSPEPPSRSRDLDNPCSYSYSSRTRSPDSHDYPRDYEYYYIPSPPPAPRLAYSCLPESSRDEPTPVRPTSRLVERTTASASYDTRSSRSTQVSAYSRRLCSRSRTPRPSYRF
ncbi:hypothetical protein EDD16DRAFT_663331 [Pisolithus croceorrhizus]|nr:hypothetical protein EDD16DRAFT_663331 [Pisolithus croceorrhizus]